jgi:hypothetical protein
MDAWEATKVVFDRVRELDPENASRMMGLLLIQDNSDKELIRLAFGPDHLLHAFVATARAELAANGKPTSPPSLQTGPPWGLPSPGAGADHHHHRHQHSPFADHQLGYDGAAADAFYADDYDVWSPAGGAHCRSFSLSDAEAAAASWRPCMYYARGYCKNGSSCRFLHGVPEDDAAEREMAVMRAKALAAAPPPQLMASAYPFSPSPKGAGVSLSFLLQQHQQQSDTQRCHFYTRRAAPRHQTFAFWFPFFISCVFAAPGRRRRRGWCSAARTCTGSRCAPLGWTAATSSAAPPRGRSTSRSRPTPPSARRTCPTTSGTQHSRPPLLSALFRFVSTSSPIMGERNETDSSLLVAMDGSSSMFGPVQDVRIPYQQKRMFGFVTFVYAETVKVILSKGNPHFVCDARVLVKPYKEKGKVPDRFRSVRSFSLALHCISSSSCHTSLPSHCTFATHAGCLFV